MSWGLHNGHIIIIIEYRFLFAHVSKGNEEAYIDNSRHIMSQKSTLRTYFLNKGVYRTVHALTHQNTPQLQSIWITMYHCNQFCNPRHCMMRPPTTSTNALGWLDNYERAISPEHRVLYVTFDPAAGSNRRWTSTAPDNTALPNNVSRLSTATDGSRIAIHSNLYSSIPSPYVPVFKDARRPSLFFLRFIVEFR
jgi:hypothetical protein